MSWQWPTTTEPVSLTVVALNTDKRLANWAFVYGVASDDTGWCVFLTTPAECRTARISMLRHQPIFCAVDELVPAELVSAFRNVTADTPEE